MVKTNENGNMLWNQTYEARGDYFIEAVQARDGGYVLAGQDLVVKVNAAGELEWETGFPEKTIRHVIVASDGGYVFAGWKGDSTYRDSEVWAAKLESDYVPPETDFSAWFFSADGVTVTVAVVAVCAVVIVAGVVVYKRKRIINKM